MDIKALLQTLQRLTQIARESRDVVDSNPRTAVVRAVASFLVASRALRGRDPDFERALWTECLVLADTLEGPGNAP